MSASPPPAVAATFASYDQKVRDGLLALRSLILETAEETEGVGPLEEVLRWNQPSYLTTKSRSGSTVRVAPTNDASNHDFGMYFICSTNLVAQFKDLFGDLLTYDGTRALLFSVGDELPENELRQCVAMALLYHRNKQLSQ